MLTNISLTTKEQQAPLDKQVQDWKKELAYLASQIAFATGKNCAVVLLQSADDGVRVMPGYKIELLNPHH